MFKRVLIANRGEIALRVLRACRELDVDTVTVCSAADRESLPAQMAGRAVCIGPARAADSWLEVTLTAECREEIGREVPAAPDAGDSAPEQP